MCLSSLTVLCVCTYRRPANLLKLLNALVELEQPGELQVVVVDNHEDRQGMGVCKQLPDSYPFIVHAFAESRPGITYARNTALREALALKPQYLAFLDDDEWPSQQWLREMRNTMQLHDSDVVGGPTLTQFPDHAPLEYRDNPYFGADMRLKDGQKCQLQAAGNAFMRADFVRVLAPDFFHPAFANSCGEDLAFFTQLSDHGAKMHWSANAVVHESVEPYRLSEEWLKSRVITVANSRVRVMQMLRPGFLHSLERTIKSCALFTYAMLQSALGLFSRNRANQARLLRWKFMGKLSAHLRHSTSRMEESM